MPDQIERELLLPAPPEQVWEVITGPGWLADEVALELFPGGEARFAPSDDGQAPAGSRRRSRRAPRRVGVPDRSGGRPTASPPRASS